MYFPCTRRKNDCAFRLVVTAFSVLFQFPSSRSLFSLYFSGFGNTEKNCDALNYLWKRKKKKERKKTETRKGDGEKKTERKKAMLSFPLVPAWQTSDDIYFRAGWVKLSFGKRNKTKKRKKKCFPITGDQHFIWMSFVYSNYSEWLVSQLYLLQATADQASH